MLPAVIVGALTAWYLGLRLGIIVAVVTALALLVASFVPGMSITVYALVLGWAALLYFFGPKIAKASGKSSMIGNVGGAVGGVVNTASGWVKTLLGNRDNRS
jgi:hypothetical protein